MMDISGRFSRRPLRLQGHQIAVHLLVHIDKCGRMRESEEDVTSRPSPCCPALLSSAPSLDQASLFR